MSTHIQNSPNSLETTTFVNYDGVVAKVVRPDIECTNGYIHLIDKVVVKVIIHFQNNVINLLIDHFRDETSPLEGLTPFFHLSLPYSLHGFCVLFSSRFVSVMSVLKWQNIHCNLWPSLLLHLSASEGWKC